MGDADGGTVTIDDIPDLDLGEWSTRVDESGTTTVLTLLSPSRKHKITVKPVSLQNPEIDTGFLAEFYEGDDAYASNRSRETSTIIPDADAVPRQLRELITEETGATP